MDDVRAVLDAVGSRRAAIVGFSEGGTMTLLFAATYPQRTAAAILFGCGASYVTADDYPWGASPTEWAEDIVQWAKQVGTTEFLDGRLKFFAPSRTDDVAFRRWWRRWVTTSASPGAMLALRRMNTEIDARQVLPTIRVPTLVLWRAGDHEYPAEGRYMAERIPGAESVELPGTDHGYFIDPEQVTREVERFLRRIWDRGDWDLVQSERVLATVLFTDIVGSTERLAELGDRRWRELLQRHHAVVRQQLVRFSGREVDTAGDGFFASFDGPARAIRCASAIRDAGRRPQSLADSDAGVHVGEVELAGEAVRGIDRAHAAARVAATAGPSRESSRPQAVRDLALQGQPASPSRTLASTS